MAIKGLPFTDEEIFKAANLAVLPAWFLLAVAPRWRITHLVTTCIALAGALLYVLLVGGLISEGGFRLEVMGSLNALAGVFARPDVMCSGWVHYLVFDLWIGKWMVTQAESKNIPHLALLPVLLATFMFGPSGLLLFIIVDAALAKKHKTT